MAKAIALRDRQGNERARVLLDEADYEWANRYRWHLLKNGYAVRNHWLGRTPEGKSRNAVIYLHRELLGLAKGDGTFVDHINGDRLDNRRANLRITTALESAQNRTGKASAKTSRHRGVDYWSVRGIWRARVGNHHVGYFKTEAESAAAAREARLRLMPGAIDR